MYSAGIRRFILLVESSKEIKFEGRKNEQTKIISFIYK